MIELVEVDGARLHTVRDGEGPPVVMLHGGPGLWDYLEPVAEMLGGVAAVCRYDQRGCGRSTGDGPHTLARQIADLEALRAHWGFERMTLLGHSWGASLAMHYALAHPSRVAGLIYVSGTGIDPGWRAANQAARAARLGEAGERERLEAQVRWDAEDTYEAEAASCIATWRSDYADPEAGREHARAMLRPGLRVNREVNAALNREAGPQALAPDMPRRLAALAMPTLVMHGEKDPRPAWAARQVADAIPGAQWRLIAGAGHLPWVEAPDAVREALRAFLRSP